MKTVKFWEAMKAFQEAMKAFQEGKEIRFCLEDSTNPKTAFFKVGHDHYAFSKDEIRGDWQIKEEPKIYQIAFCDDGTSYIQHDGTTFIISTNKRVTKVIRVREVAE